MAREFKKEGETKNLLYFTFIIAHYLFITDYSNFTGKHCMIAFRPPDSKIELTKLI